MTTLSPAEVPASGPPPSDLETAAPEVGTQPSRRLLRAVAIGLAVLGLVGLAILLYACSVHAIQGDSDGATVVLEGRAYTQGNLLLHGWALSLDSFWAVDALIYAILVGLAGVRPALLYVGPAIIAAGIIVVGCFIAREGRRGAAAIAGCVTVIAVLGLPTHMWAYFFLRGPLHVGTALWALIAFAALRYGRFGLWWAIGVLFLAGGLLGDLQMVAYGVVPVAIAGVVAMLRERDWRTGIAQVAAAVSALVLDEVVRKIRGALGGFTIGATNPTVGLHQLRTNVKHVGTYGSQFFGLRDTLFGTGGVPTWLQRVHVVSAVLLTVCLVAALVGLVLGVVKGPGASGSRAIGEREGSQAVASEEAARAGQPADTGQLADTSRPAHRRPHSPAALWRLDDMLAIATFGPPAAFVALAITSDPQYSRYLTAGVIFAAVLSGRMVARFWPRLRGASAKAVAAAGIAFVALFAVGVGYTLAAPEPSHPAAGLVSWLESHDLHNGVSDYWTASLATVESDGKVTLRPVVTGKNMKLRRYTKQSADTWYAGQKFQFFVWDTQLPWGGDDTQTAINTWGTPSQITMVGPYWVLQWHRPLSVAPNPPPGS